MLAAAGVALSAQAAFAQAVGDNAPVPRKVGLLGEYYSYPVGSATPPGNPPGSPDPTPPVQAGAAFIAERLEPTMTINYQGNPPPGNNNSSDWFMVVYTGFINITTAGDYTFQTISDDGERSWFGNPTAAAPDFEAWVQRGTTNGGNPDIFHKGTLNTGLLPVRYELEQGNGGISIQCQWSTVAAPTIVDIPGAQLVPPDGPVAPTLNVTSPIGSGPAVVNLSWNQPAGATGYIISRQTVSTPNPNTPVPMRVIALINSGATLTYQDNAVQFGASYNYIIQATSHTMICIGPATANQPANPVQPWVIATPNTGLQTNENLASTTFDIIFTQPAPAGCTVTVTSSNTGEGTVSANSLSTTPVANGFSFNVVQGQSPTITVTVTGVDDALVDGPIAYTVNVNATGITGPQSPPVQLTNQDNDIQGLTFTRTSGIITTESGGQAQFSVQLNRAPFGNVSFSLTSSNVLEGTVLPGTLTFTATGGQPYSAATGFGGWNVAHDVTVTGVDDTLLDFTIPYTIVTGALQFADTRDQTAFTNAGVTAVPDVACINLDNEVPPELPTVWGNGGCGLLGLELAAPVLLAGLLRRRRR